VPSVKMSGKGSPPQKETRLTNGTISIRSLGRQAALIAPDQADWSMPVSNSL
jgi:hypothetical protein